MSAGSPVTGVRGARELPPRGNFTGEVSGLSGHQEYQAARLVASASTDAADCAQLLAALGIHPADGIRSVIAQAAEAIDE